MYNLMVGMTTNTLDLLDLRNWHQRPFQPSKKARHQQLHLRAGVRGGHITPVRRGGGRRLLEVGGMPGQVAAWRRWAGGGGCWVASTHVAGVRWRRRVVVVAAPRLVLITWRRVLTDCSCGRAVGGRLTTVQPASSSAARSHCSCRWMAPGSSRLDAASVASASNRSPWTSVHGLRHWKTRAPPRLAVVHARHHNDNNQLANSRRRGDVTLVSRFAKVTPSARPRIST